MQPRRRLVVVERARGDHVGRPPHERGLRGGRVPDLLGDLEVGQHPVAGVERAPRRVVRRGQGTAADEERTVPSVGSRTEGRAPAACVRARAAPNAAPRPTDRVAPRRPARARSGPARPPRPRPCATPPAAASQASPAASASKKPSGASARRLTMVSTRPVCPTGARVRARTRRRGCRSAPPPRIDRVDSVGVVVPVAVVGREAAAAGESTVPSGPAGAGNVKLPGTVLADDAVHRLGGVRVGRARPRAIASELTSSASSARLSIVSHARW